MDQTRPDMYRRYQDYYTRMAATRARGEAAAARSHLSVPPPFPPALPSWSMFPPPWYERAEMPVAPPFPPPPFPTWEAPAAPPQMPAPAPATDIPIMTPGTTPTTVNVDDAKETKAEDAASYAGVADPPLNVDHDSDSDSSSDSDSDILDSDDEIDHLTDLLHDLGDIDGRKAVKDYFKRRDERTEYCLGHNVDAPGFYCGGIGCHGDRGGRGRFGARGGRGGGGRGGHRARHERRRCAAPHAGPDSDKTFVPGHWHCPPPRRPINLDYDCFQTPDKIIIHVTAPGCNKESFNIGYFSISARFVISATRQRPHHLDPAILSPQGVAERIEWSIPVAEAVEGDHITAKLQDGILIIHAPKLNRVLDPITKVQVA